MRKLIGSLNLWSGVSFFGGWLGPGVDLQQVCPVVEWLVVVEVASLDPAGMCRRRTRALPFWTFFGGGPSAAAMQAWQVHVGPRIGLLMLGAPDRVADGRSSSFFRRCFSPFPSCPRRLGHALPYLLCASYANLSYAPVSSCARRLG